MTPLRVFITGTDTGVGKTDVACALLSLMADGGLRPAALKPYESGVRPGGATDAEALRVAASAVDPLEHVCVHRFRAPLAPALAAAREGRDAEIAPVDEALRRFEGRALVVEGAGGLFVPLDAQHDVIDLIVRSGLPVLLVARAGLGTINHVGLSIEALRARGVPVLAVVLNRSHRGTDLSERENASVLRARHGVTVLGPVAYAKDASRRRAALRRALRPLIYPAKP